MKCPNCGNEIYETDIIDSDCYGNDYCDIVRGTCYCGLTWQWKEIFTFDHIEDIQQISENDHL